MKVNDVLATVGELGFVEISKNGAIYITPPAINLHKQRLDIFGKLLFEYKKRKPDAIFKGFFTLYDAWREHAEPAEEPKFLKLGKKNLQLFVGKGTLGEPGRFIQPFFLKNYFPVFDYPILSFGHHKNDPFVQLLPDPDYVVSEGYLGLRDEIERDDCDWEGKVQKLYWRGSMHGFSYKAYDKLQLRSQRALLVDWGRDHKGVSDVSVSKNVSKCEQLRHKYLLDVDGEVNAWSGLFWKLYSNSVVFKVDSHYEQWYYRRLEPWVHYIPVAGDLSDLEEKFDWAVTHDDICSQIAQSGRVLASSLSFYDELDQLELVGETKDLFSCYTVRDKICFQIPQQAELKIIHTYQPRCRTVSQPPGFGDFLRGTVTLYQLSKKYGFNLCLDFSSHPLHLLLKRHDCSIERKQLPVYEFFNQKNCELESFIVGQANLGKMYITTHAVPDQNITRQCRQFLLKHLKPNKELSDYISTITTTLNLDGYCTVHIRMGDHQFANELTLPPIVENWFVEEILPVWGANVLVISDNVSLKRVLKNMFNIKVIDVKPIHLGLSVLCDASGEEVRDTLTEFLLMGRSSWIYQYSVYPWGSSFSEICAKIYDIPFERLLS